MTLVLVIVAALPVLVGNVAAHAQPDKPSLSALPDIVKSQKWKDIDIAALSMPERCGSLLLLNDALDELSASSGADADLMSQYIDEQNLGQQFSSFSPPAAPAVLTCDDALKVAVAMLRGPLAASPYVTQYAGATDRSLLDATAQMYHASSQRKWSAFADHRQQVRWMSAFLQSKNAMPAYQTWARAEVTRRDEAYQKEMARKQAASAAQSQAQEERAQQLYAQRLERDKAAEQSAPPSQQMQQALGAAERQTQPSSSQAGQGQVVQPDAVGYPSYDAAVVVPAGWYRDAAYRGAAAANVENRFNGWHGAGAHRR